MLKILPLFNYDTIESFISQFMDIEENYRQKDIGIIDIHHVLSPLRCLDFLSKVKK